MEGSWDGNWGSHSKLIGGGKLTAVIEKLPDANYRASFQAEYFMGMTHKSVCIFHIGERGAVWQFQGQANQHIRIELRSEEFDTYVQLLDAQGNRLAEDDDSLGDLNSMVEINLPANGMYQIVVNNFGEDRRAGIYTLSLIAH